MRQTQFVSVRRSLIVFPWTDIAFLQKVPKACYTKQHIHLERLRQTILHRMPASFFKQLCALSLVSLSLSHPVWAVESLPFDVVQRFEQSQIETAGQYLIRSQDELRSFWLKHAREQALPKVDFNTYWLIVVLAGPRPTAAYGHCVTQVQVTSQGLSVAYQSQSPPGDGFLPMITTHPGCLVRLAKRASAQVQFIEVTETNRKPALPMRTLAQQSNSLIISPRFTVSQDLASFKLLWREHAGDLESLPDVDFEHEMVLLAAMGEQTTGGYSLKITEVVEENGRLIAHMKRIEPDPSQMVIQMLTAPVHFVIVPRQDLPVDFVE